MIAGYAPVKTMHGEWMMMQFGLSFATRIMLAYQTSNRQGGYKISKFPIILLIISSESEITLDLQAGEAG